jgi:hypothetical protein
LARAQTRDKQSKLDQFRKSLGEYAAWASELRGLGNRP